LRKKIKKIVKNKKMWQMFCTTFLKSGGSGKNKDTSFFTDKQV